MPEMKHIHEFAVRWKDKFTDRNAAEFSFDSMGEDCAALGFEMDCGSAFTEKYGEAAVSGEALERIVGEVGDISLLGSAIYSRWRYFNHWAYSGAEILEPQNRAWFVIALTRLEELSSVCNDSFTVFLFPDFEALKKEVGRLRTEISMLLLERDELRFVICRNIEAAYMLALGSLEYKAFKLNCSVLRLKRKIELIQAKRNRQEKVVLSAVEEILDKEFSEFKRQLDEQTDKMNKAIERSKGAVLTDEETKELKKMYRGIVKSLHPDLHPDVTPAQLRLFNNAVQAYENGDLSGLRIISDMVTDPVVPERKEDAMTVLVKDKKRLADTLEIVRKQIADIKSEYPYTVKDIVEDPEKTAERKAELEQTIGELKEVHGIYSARLKEMLR